MRTPVKMFIFLSLFLVLGVVEQSQADSSFSATISFNTGFSIESEMTVVDPRAMLMIIGDPEDVQAFEPLPESDRFQFAPDADFQVEFNPESNVSFTLIPTENLVAVAVLKETAFDLIQFDTLDTLNFTYKPPQVTFDANDTLVVLLEDKTYVKLGNWEYLPGDFAVSFEGEKMGVPEPNSFILLLFGIVALISVTIKKTRLKNLLPLFIVLALFPVPAMAGYHADKELATDGGGTWGAILNVSVDIKTSTAAFTVTKKEGTFKNTSNVTIKYDTPNGIDAAVGSVEAGEPAITLAVDLAGLSGYPHKFYAHVENWEGFAYAGFIEITPSNDAPFEPMISSEPSVATVSQPIDLLVIRGVDPDADPVNVRCTATNSNHPDANPFVSEWDNGSTPVTVSFVFSGEGTQMIACATIDKFGASSQATQRVINVKQPQPCTYSLYSTNGLVGKETTDSEVYVNTQDNCSWTATSNESWITIPQGNGTGGGIVQFAVAANDGKKSRTGTINIAGQTVTVTQKGLIAEQITLTITKEGSGTGRVKGPGIDCGEVCTTVYKQGRALYLIAEEDGDSKFEGWKIDGFIGHSEDGKPLQTQLVVGSDVRVTAVFNKKQEN